MSDLVTDNPVGAANDVLMAKEMAEALHSQYPGHLWAVSCDGRIGFADVRNLALSGNYGFRLKLDHIYSASDFRKRVIRAGGEILERYRLDRGRMDMDKYSSLATDFAGRLKVEM